MFKGLIENVKGAFLGNPYWLVLEKQDGRIVLSTYRGETRILLALIASKHKAFGYLCNSLARDGDVLVVPIQSLEEVKQILSEVAHTTTYQIEIAADLDQVHRIEPPSDFLISFDWSERDGCLRPHVSHGASYAGKGWFTSNDAYWPLPGMTVDDDALLLAGEIRGQDIMRLVARKVPAWKKRNFPMTSDVDYSPTPFIAANVAQVTDESVSLEVSWRDDPGKASEVPGLPGYVIAGNKMMPGVPPTALPEPFRKRDGIFSLSGQNIPLFLSDTWPHLKPFAKGEIDELAKRHLVLRDQCELILTMRREITSGIGRASVLPTCVCGGYRYSAEALSRKMEPGILRVRPGWLPVAALKNVGIAPMGKMSDGRPLNAIPMTPGELFGGGSPRLNGPWVRLESLHIDIPVGTDSHEIARKHLELLRAWGVPGGIVGGLDQYSDAVRDVCASLLADAPEAKILMIAEKQAFPAIEAALGLLVKAKMDGSAKDPHLDVPPEGVTLAAPTALTSSEGLQLVDWTMIALVGADALVKSDTSRFFSSLASCKRELTIGLFGDATFLERKAQRKALSAAFALIPAEAELVWRHTLRDPKTPSPLWPETYVIRPSSFDRSRDVGPAEMVIGIAKPTRSFQIPPKPMATPQSEPRLASDDDEGADAGISFTINIEDERSAFVEKARRLVSRKEAHATFVPFMCYWPTYDSMTQPQAQWYFYWRDRMRHEDYIDTDLSYIFVHVYELINSIGVSGPADGYDQLRRLWLAYRGRFPKLDRYLVDWMTDYVIVNKVPGDPLQVYAEAMKVGAVAANPDLMLSLSLSRPLSELSVAMIDKLADYHVLKGKFCAAGNREIISKYVPLALDAVDRHMKETAGGGIFERFKPRAAEGEVHVPFLSAVYAGDTRKIRFPKVLPYSSHEPLRAFLAAVVKHTENRLRELKKFKSKLRGYTLEPDIQAVIDTLIASAAEQLAPRPARPKVVINLEELKKLQEESDQVRDMLMVDGETVPPQEHITEEHRAVAKRHIPRPEGTPDGLLTDLDPVYEVLSQLAEEERRIIGLFAANRWEASDAYLAGKLPGVFFEPMIDRINSLALDALGDHLIVVEGDANTVTEDYRDEIEYLLAQETPAGGASAQEHGLPNEWANFMSRLSPIQLSVLEVVARKAAPMEEIRRIALDNGAMPEALVDSINEAAVSTIGDCIIEPGSMPPVIEQEDFQMVEMILNVSQAR